MLKGTMCRVAHRAVMLTGSLHGTSGNHAITSVKQLTCRVPTAVIVLVNLTDAMAYYYPYTIS